MPLRVYYKNDTQQPCTIRPTPLVSIAPNILKTGGGESFGVTYTLTLTGTIIADQGTPYALDQNGQRYPFHSTSLSPNSIGPYGAFDNNVGHSVDSSENGKPPKQRIDHIQASNAVFFKQQALRALFAQDGQKLEISDFNDNEPTIICYPRLININFEEGIYVDTCRFTITLECDTLLDKDHKVNIDGTLVSIDGITTLNNTEDRLLTLYSGAFIQDFNENWSLEVDDNLGESANNPRSYRISHSLSATGKTHYTPSGEKLKAWEQARKFVHHRLSNSVNDYPNVMGTIGSGTVNLINAYGGFNHIRSEQIDESAGTYSVSENWLIASGSAYENYNLSTSIGIDSPFVRVSIDGNIKGLSQISPSGYGTTGGVSAYSNALNKYQQVTKSGQFGLSSEIYKRANAVVAPQLNSQPLAISIGSNEYLGEITYNVQFDSRPTNIISGVLSESINVSDTYPGDVYAVIPIPGRATGPILQAIGGRTEYRRDVSIDLLLDYNQIPYGSGRNLLLLKKPSVIEPTATQLANLIRELSPAYEPNIRKYFLNPPQESWQPKNGSYSISLSWVYELSR